MAGVAVTRSRGAGQAGSGQEINFSFYGLDKLVFVVVQSAAAQNLELRRCDDFTLDFNQTGYFLGKRFITALQENVTTF